MSYVGQEDWVHVDDHFSEIEELEKQVSDLENQVKELRDDEVFILAEIMWLRDHYSDYRDMRDELTGLIKLHDESVKRKAVDMLLKKYPNRHWGEF